MDIDDFAEYIFLTLKNNTNKAVIKTVRQYDTLIVIELTDGLKYILDVRIFNVYSEN